MISPVRVRRCTVLADARPGGRLPPLDRAEIERVEARESRTHDEQRQTRVGAAAVSELSSGSSGGIWKIWLPLVLVPIGGLVGFGAATILGLKACSRMAIALGGGLALGATGAATISLMNPNRSST
jgi:hypothetical protein